MSPTKSVLRFAKLSENAFPPLKGSTYAAGWDLRRSVFIFVFLFKNKYCIFSAYDYVLPARGKVTALTDIQIAVPDGCYGRVGQYLAIEFSRK
jgi:dUTP pyrophosphatase